MGLAKVSASLESPGYCLTMILLDYVCSEGVEGHDDELAVQLSNLVQQSLLRWLRMYGVQLNDVSGFYVATSS